MAMKDDDLESARDAYTEFHARNKEWLYGIVRKSHYHKLIGREQDIGEVVQGALVKAYYNANSFRVREIGDRDKSRWEARRWLVGIARNEVAELLRGRKNTPETSLPPDFDETFATPEGWDETDSEEQIKVTNALEQLSEREQDVIRTTFLYQKPGVEYQRLPNDVCKELAERLGLTAPHIRTIRKRAMDKIYLALGVEKPTEGRRT